MYYRIDWLWARGALRETGARLVLVGVMRGVTALMVRECITGLCGWFGGERRFARRGLFKWFCRGPAQTAVYVDEFLMLASV
jgi:hypothetical protein